MGNNRNSRNTNKPTTTPAPEAPAPESTNALGTGNVSPAFGKPSDVDATQLAINESKARQTIADSVVGAGAGKTDDATESVVLTTIESQLHRLGVKSAVEIVKHELSTDSVAIIYANSDALPKLSVVGKTDSSAGVSVLTTHNGGFVGIDTTNLKRLILSVDRAKVAEAIAANAKAPRVAGNGNGYTCTMVYAPVVPHVGVNRVIKGEIVSGAGVMHLSVVTDNGTTETTLTIASADSMLLTGKPQANGKKRDYQYVDVAYVDGTTERINSAWFVGLANAVNARKLAIKGDDASAIKLAQTVATDASASAENTDDDSSENTDDATE